MHFCFFSKSFLNVFRNFNESSTFFTQILKSTTYSDSPWKTASESVGIKTILTTFVRSTRSLRRCAVFEKFDQKTRIRGNSDTSSSIERNLLYNMYYLVFFPTWILEGTSVKTVFDDNFPVNFHEFISKT